MWQTLCEPARRRSNGNGGIVFGSTTPASGRTRVEGLGLVLQWESVRGIGDTTKRLETITTRRDSLGNYVFCGVRDFGPAAAAASSSEWRSDNVLVPADPSSLRRVDLVVGPREGRERSRPSVDAIGYLSDAQRMDVTEQGVTELVVRIIKGTVALNNRPRAGGARYDAVRARRTALELMPRPRSLFATPTGH